MRHYRCIVFLISLFIFSACCSRKANTTNYTLKPNDGDIVPYQVGQKVNFRHSSGSEINFIVTGRRKEVYKDSGNGEEPFDCTSYWNYESEIINLLSTNPQIQLIFEIFGNEGDSSSALKATIVYLGIFHFQRPMGICIPAKEYICYDSLTLLNHTYYNAIQITPDSSDFTPGYLRAKSIIYNKQDGLLQFLLNNNETFTLEKK